MEAFGAHHRASRGAMLAIAGLFIVSCGVRLMAVGVALRSPQYNPYEQIRGADMASFTALAVSLSQGEGYSDHYGPHLVEFFRDPKHVRPTAPSRPTARKGIGYPLFLAMIFRTVGYHLLPVIVLQVLLSALSTLLVYAIARLVGSRELAMTAYAIAVFYYPFWHMAVMLLVSTVLIFLTLLSLYGLITWFRRPTVTTACWTGLAVGVAFLVKPLLLPIIPFFLAAAYFWHRRHGTLRPFWRGAIALTVMAVVVVAPWVVRNYQQMGQLLITPSYGGYQFLQVHNRYNLDFALYRDAGNIDEAFPGFREVVLPELKLSVELSEEMPPLLAEYLQDQAYARSARQFIVSRPWQFARSLLRSIGNMWRVDYPDAKMYRKLSNLLGYVGLAPFVVLGIATAIRRRNSAALLLASFLVYFVAFHAILASTIRYRLVAMPVWFVLGALGLCEAWQLWRRSHERNRQIVGSQFAPSGPIV